MIFKHKDAKDYICPMGRSGTTDKVCVGRDCAVFVPTMVINEDGTISKLGNEGTCGLGKNV